MHDKTITPDFTKYRDDLVLALRLAVDHLQELGEFAFFNDEVDIFTSVDLSSLIEQSIDHLNSGDDCDCGRLWGVFAPTCTWDDAGGDSRLGQRIFELLDTRYRPNRNR